MGLGAHLMAPRGDSPKNRTFTVLSGKGWSIQAAGIARTRTLVGKFLFGGPASVFILSDEQTQAIW